MLRCEDEIAQLRERLSELEHEISAQQQRGLELKGESRPAREPHPFQRGAAARVRRPEHQGHGRPDPGRGTAPRRRAGARRGDRPSEPQAESALEQHRQALAARQEALRQVEEELRQQQEALRQAQADAFAAAQDLTRVRNEITALDLQKQGNVVRLEKLSAEKIQLEEERTRLEARLHEFVANVAAREAQCANAARHRRRTAEAPARNPGGTRARRPAAGPGPGTAGREPLPAERAGAIAGRPRRLQRRPAHRRSSSRSMCWARWRTRFACPTNT